MINVFQPKIFCPLCHGDKWILVDTPEPNSHGMYICEKCKI